MRTVSNGTSAKAAARIIVIAIFTAYAIALNAMDLQFLWHPYANAGFTADRQGVVLSVRPWMQSAGLHAGDKIDLRRLTVDDRRHLNSVVWGGRTMRLTLVSGRTVVSVARPLPRSLADNVSDVFEILASIATALIAAFLVLWRPLPSTWAFYAFAYPFFTFAASGNLAAETPLVYAAYALFFILPHAVSPAAFTSFALRFPTMEPSGAGKRLESALLYVVTPALVLATIAVDAAYVYYAVLPPARWGFGVAVFGDVIYAIGIAVLLGRYVSADALNRSRLRWIVAAFAVAYLPFLALMYAWSSLFGATTTAPWIINYCQVCEIVAPIALAYTILKHRLFDVRVVFSRALLYTVIMAFSVGILALIDWGLGRWLEQSRFALLGELALALVLGSALTMVHGRLEKFVNSVVFRAQTLALAALRRFALETDLIADPQRLLAQTHEVLDTRLESDFAAIYTLDGSSYVLATGAIEGVPSLLAADDFAVLRLRRWHEPFECDEPRHVLRGSLMLPMTARGELVGFVACGPKRDRTHYLPEEVETLSTLTHRVGSAYALLTFASGDLRMTHHHTGSAVPGS